MKIRWSHSSAVCCGDLRNEESYDLCGRKATSVIEPLEDAVDGVEWLRNSEVGRGLGGVCTTDEDVEARGTRAVGNTNSTGQLNAVNGMSSCVHLHDMRNGLQVSSREVVALDEWALLVDDLVDTKVRVEVGFYVFEKCNRTICASAAVHQHVSHSYPVR